MVPFIKAHAYGNDFLYVSASHIAPAAAARAAERMCSRHRGVGADGLILYTPTPRGASMKLLNADGSAAELSGNGLRGLAAILIRAREAAGDAIDPELEISTTAGLRRLLLTGRDGSRYVLDADMGQPSGLTQQILSAAGETVTVSVLSMGNPQCVLLGPIPDDERFARLGRRWSITRRFRMARTSSSPSSRRRTACASASGNAVLVPPSRPAPDRARPPSSPRPTAARNGAWRLSPPAAGSGLSGLTQAYDSPAGPRSSARVSSCLNGDEQT